MQNVAVVMSVIERLENNKLEAKSRMNATEMQYPTCSFLPENPMAAETTQAMMPSAKNTNVPMIRGVGNIFHVREGVMRL